MSHEFLFDHKYLEPTKADFRWVAVQVYIPTSSEEAIARVNAELLAVNHVDFAKRGKTRKIARRKHIMLIHELQCRWGLVDQAPKKDAKEGNTSNPMKGNGLIEGPRLEDPERRGS